MDLVPADPLTEPTCEAPLDGFPCGAPAVLCDLDSPTDPDERESGHPGFLCAHHARRLEVDAWLAEQEAVVIQVRDLAAALEAVERRAPGQRPLGGRRAPPPLRGPVAMSDLRPLTDDEAALIAHVERWGSAGYPVERFGKSWQIVSFRSWPGYPTTYKTKRAAVEQFRRWLGLALERWAAMKREHPEAILTAVGIRGLEANPEVYACPGGERCADPECIAENERRATA